jgi:tetratricopeptide (TPR) repeat protein
MRSARTQIEHGLTQARAGDWDGAERVFTEVIARYPESWEALVNRGNVRQERGDFDAAMADFTQAVELRPANVAPYFNRGNARALVGDLRGAITDFDAAIAVDASFVRAFERRGHLLQRLGEDERAEADFTAAIDLAPERVDAYAQRAALRALRGSIDAAMADCERALLLVSKTSKQRDALSRLLNTLIRTKDGEAVATRKEASRAASAGKWTESVTKEVCDAFERRGLEFRVRRSGEKVSVRSDEFVVRVDGRGRALSFETLLTVSKRKRAAAAKAQKPESGVSLRKAGSVLVQKAELLCKSTKEVGPFITAQLRRAQSLRRRVS